MITELVHQKNCNNFNIITDISTGEKACCNCGSVSPERFV